MKKWISIIPLICAAYGFSKCDTVYVDHHTVTYIKPAPISSSQNAAFQDSTFPNLPQNRISVNIDIMSLDFSLSYERLLAQHANAVLQVGYRNEESDDFKAKDGTTGSIKAIEVGIGGKLVFGRDIEKTKSIDIKGNVNSNNSTGELFVLALLQPTFANMDFQREATTEKEALSLGGNKFALFTTLGLGYTSTWEHIFISGAMAFRKILVEPQWITDFEYYDDDHFEHPLLDKFALVYTFSIGWAF